MSVACYSVLTGGGTNQELALHCLHDCRGDVIVSRPHCPAVSSFIFCYFLPLALFISLCVSRTLSLSHPYTHTHTHTTHHFILHNNVWFSLPPSLIERLLSICKKLGL